MPSTVCGATNSGAGVSDGGSAHEVPEAVKNLVAARTGDAVYVVGPDYSVVHWDSRTESLSGTLAEEALGKPCYEAVMGESGGGEPFCAHGCSVITSPGLTVPSRATRCA